MNNTSKKIKSLLSGLLANDELKINNTVKELTESIMPDKEEKIMKVLIESFRGETDV